MTTIRLGVLHPTGTATDERSRGSVEWVPSARRVVGADVILPDAFRVTLVADADVTVDVAPTTTAWVWKVLERVRGGSGGWRYLVVPDSAEVVDYAALVEVDPATLDPIAGAPTVADELALKAPSASPAFTGTPTGITKAHVGLGSVDNTADAAKPVSTAQGVALGLKLDTAVASATYTASADVDAAVAAKIADTASATRAAVAPAFAPRLTHSHVANRTGIKNGWETQGVEQYVTFCAFYHVYDVAYKTTGATYALARPVGAGTTQGVWRSFNAGETWTKLFDLTISIATGVWFESIFVEPFGETIYLQKLTNGNNEPYHNYVESFTSAGVLLGSKDVGDSKWISGSHTIDANPSNDYSQRIVIFGEYAGLSKVTCNLWRTVDRGVTWTSVLSQTGNNGVVYSGEIRHFHVVAVDPYTKHWWAGSGDGDSQCKIWRSTDMGVTWTMLWSGTQRERTTSFTFTSTYVYYGMDSAQTTQTHSKIVRITKSNLTRTDVATVKNGFPVWMLTKTFAPEGFIVWPSCEFAANTRQDFVTVQWFDFTTEKLSDIGRFSIKEFTTGTEGIHDASRHQDVATGAILFTPTANILLRSGFNTGTVSTFERARLTLST